ncbi:MAG: sulfatase [Acidobacteriota bacterium]
MTRHAAVRHLRGAVLVFLACLVPGCAGNSRPSILFITIDTLRADHVSSYGYGWPTTPTLDALAASGARFTGMVAPLPETAPACATLLTGRWPGQLGMHGNGQPLGPDVETLATRLRQEGYATAAFVSGFPLTRRLSGLARGFTVYDDALPDARGRVPGVQRVAAKTAAAALKWLGQRRSTPFFAWVHFYDPHGDYDPGPPYDTLFGPAPAGPDIPLADIPAYQRRDSETDAAAYLRRYDGEIRRVDDQVRRLLAKLDDTGDRPRTLVVITADHGESLTEHGYFFDHGNEIYQPSTHVPFILNGPGVASRPEGIDGVARTVDIMPTVLDLLGVAPASDAPGRSLRPRLTGAVPAEPPEAFTEARFKPYRALTPGADVGPKLAARDDRFTAILRLATSRLEIYDRLADPGETDDLSPALAAGAGGRDLLRRVDGNLRRLRDATTAGAVYTPRVFGQTEREFLQRWTAQERRK